MNLLGQKAEESKEAPAPEQAPSPAPDCHMCGAMVEHQNPEKTKAAMGAMSKAFGK